MTPQNDQLPLEEIVRRLERSEQRQLESPFPPGFLKPFLRPAAVLIPLLIHEGHWHLLFIRRSSIKNDPHSSQVAFPGGRRDPHEKNPVETALREAHEEIGIQPQDIRILGRLHEFATITGYRVTPVVGMIPWPYELVLQQGEVSRAFTIPLEWLADDANRDIRLRHLPSPFDPIKVIYYKLYDGELLWGATARFTESFLQTLGIELN